MGLKWLQGTSGSSVNSWECAFCRRRSRAANRIVLTIDSGRAGAERVRCCDLECLKRLLALWEELEDAKSPIIHREK